MKKLTLTFILILVTQLSFGQSAIQVQKSGKGNPVIFLPGFTTPGSVFNETIKNLEQKNENHVVTYAGFNGLEAISTPWYESVKNELIKYIKNEKLSNITLIGHSMGANLAIDIAVELPSMTTNLIIIESIPCMREVMMPGVPASSLQYDSPYNKQILEMTDEAFKQMATGISQNMTSDASKVEKIINWSVIADRKTYVYGYTDLLKMDQRDQLSKITAKTLILGASFPNKEIIRSNYDKQYENLKSKEIIIADNSKHFIMYDQPEWFYKKVNNFLNSNDQ